MPGKYANGRKSKQDDWMEYYGSREFDENSHDEIDEKDFRNLPYASLMSYLSKEMTNDSLIEIGAGDSRLLVDIKKRFRPQRVVGIDYLPKACDLLRRRVENEGVDIEVFCADMYTPPDNLVGVFDMAVSYGVVEHFNDLPGAVAAISKFVKPGGCFYFDSKFKRKCLSGIDAFMEQKGL